MCFAGTHTICMTIISGKLKHPRGGESVEHLASNKQSALLAEALHSAWTCCARFMGLNYLCLRRGSGLVGVAQRLIGGVWLSLDRVDDWGMSKVGFGGRGRHFICVDLVQVLLVTACELRDLVRFGTQDFPNLCGTLCDQHEGIRPT